MNASFYFQDLSSPGFNEVGGCAGSGYILGPESPGSDLDLSCAIDGQFSDLYLVSNLEYQNDNLDINPMQRYIHGVDGLPFSTHNMYESLRPTDYNPKQNQKFFVPSPELSFRPGSPDENESFDSSFSQRSWSSTSHSDDMKTPYHIPAGKYSATGISCREWNGGHIELHSQPHAPSVGITLSQVQGFEEQSQVEHHDDTQDGDGYYDHEELGVATAHIDDAESIEGMDTTLDDVDQKMKDSDVEEDDESDSEFRPSSRPTRAVKRAARSTPKKGVEHRTYSIGSIASAGGGLSKRKAKSKITLKTNAERYFPCTFAAYGCPAMFASKNEWKRHSHTQHIKLGFWRCELCPVSPDPQRPNYNDFNRKDLFTQHCRRMHAHYPSPEPDQIERLAADKTSSPKLSDEAVSELQTNYYRRLRSNPPKSNCLFCHRSFAGEPSWDERMEHIASHLEKYKRLKQKVPEFDSWKEDRDLRDWYLDEGLIDVDSKGQYKLGDGIPKNRENPYRVGLKWVRHD